MPSDFERPVAPGEHRLAIFASGAGTNAENVIRYFRSHASIYVALIVTNKPTAGVIEVAARYGIPCEVRVLRTEEDSAAMLDLLSRNRIEMILLAGYLSLIPSAVIARYPHRIYNIHPALLPKYGGRGMYGRRVHEAVYAAGERETGITIHEVDEVYDNGAVVFQATTEITPEDTPATIEEKVRALEYRHLPHVVEKLLLTGRN